MKLNKITEMTNERHLYLAAATALARYAASRIVANAQDNQEDPTSYATDEEVIAQYAKELLRDASTYVPTLVAELTKK